MAVRYKCIAHCPELDSDGSPHCAAVVEDIFQLRELRNKECPCGNNPQVG